MIPPEFAPIEAMKAELWWRVPLAWLSITAIFAVIVTLTEQDYDTYSRREGEASQDDTLVARPNTLHWLRFCALVAFTRFAWIYFASIDASFYHEITKIEALVWLIYIGIVVPIWTWHEKELLCLWLSSNDNNT